MKPRLYLRDGVWTCRSTGGRYGLLLGFGYTPAEAYGEWKRDMGRTA